MTKFSRLIATCLVLPLAVLAVSLGASATLDAGQPVGLSRPMTMSAIGSGTAYQCCWVYAGGRWWCYPC
jgi:hypothetical protein